MDGWISHFISVSTPTPRHRICHVGWIRLVGITTTWNERKMRRLSSLCDTGEATITVLDMSNTCAFRKYMLPNKHFPSLLKLICSKLSVSGCLSMAQHTGPSRNGQPGQWASSYLDYCLDGSHSKWLYLIDYADTEGLALVLSTGRRGCRGV